MTENKASDVSKTDKLAALAAAVARRKNIAAMKHEPVEETDAEYHQRVMDTPECWVGTVTD